MVVSYNGSVGDYPIITSHIMTATTESVLDNVLVTGLVKNEPEDLTGQRHRYVMARWLMAYQILN